VSFFTFLSTYRDILPDTMADKFSPPAPDASLEENIRFLIQSAVNTHTQFEETKALLSNNQTRIVKVEKDVSQLSNEMKQLKDLVNLREQQARSLCVRLVNLPLVEDEIDGPDPAAATAKLAYERVIRPLLVSAKAKGKSSTVPTLPNTIVKAYRLAKPTARAPPPPIVVHLMNSNIKSAIFIAKKDALPRPTDLEKSQGIKQLLLTEDLTPPTFAFLKKLKDDKRISRAWTVEGQIRYILDGDGENIIRKVRSVFSPVDSLFNK
jgi:hypothetical protein